MNECSHNELTKRLVQVADRKWFMVYLISNSDSLRDVDFEFTCDNNPHPVQMMATSHKSFGGDTLGDVIHSSDDCRFTCITTKEQCDKQFSIAVYSSYPLPNGFRVKLSGVGANNCKVTLKHQDMGIIIDSTINGDHWHSWNI